MKNSNTLPLVTVIIPCFNREKFIKSTLESVMNQTYKNMEIIVIDDGSTDNTRDIINKYEDTIKILEHSNRSNKGQSASINLGLKHSKGEYIAILDSDDLFIKNKIEQQVSFLINNNEIGLVYSNGFAIDINGAKLYKLYSKDHKETNIPEKILLNCYFLVPSNSLIRRTAFEKAGEFDESLRSAQDHDMAIRLAEITKFAYLDEYLFCYRRHNDSISVKNAELRWRNGFYILKKATKRYHYSTSAKLKRLAVLNFRLAQCFCEDKKYLRSFIRLIIAGILDPLRSIKVLIKREHITGPH
jgi:glycosyltransferase involved in cell wall biosynthesis